MLDGRESLQFETKVRIGIKFHSAKLYPGSTLSEDNCLLRPIPKWSSHGCISVEAA